jgi:Fe-S-cluster-containing dehydrogenase component/DMSO reductase anchor subunit
MTRITTIVDLNSSRLNASDSSLSLVDLLLEEQHDLTAVERFSRDVDSGDFHSNTGRYHRLLPAAPPRKGEQYAFEVDLDRCSGCKACVTACHNLNGLDEQEAWRDVGLLIGGTSVLPVLQHVTTSCHHCLSPACQIACPVNAYEKHPVTGIVKHLDDQCFGCQYCTLACPYDVPKYHSDKGIVRKCDMCSARLAVGEAPACVQACPNEAITIRVVNVENVIEDSEATLFLPAAPDPQITYPTTTFKSRFALPRNMLPADYFHVTPQHPHWPLIVMLVFTQLSVGTFACGVVLSRFVPDDLANVVHPVQAVMALVFGLLALSASVLHLGRPQYAFRAVLGLSHSWLSREIVAFGLFAPLACVYAVALVWPDPPRWPPFHREMISLLSWNVVIVGGLALFCSVMIYASLQREFWNLTRTSIRFFMTSLWLGMATLWLSLMSLTAYWPREESYILLSSAGPVICNTLIIVSVAKLAWEAMIFQHLLSRAMTSMKRSALLMAGDLATLTIARFSLGVLGGIAAPALSARLLMSNNIQEEAIECIVATALIFVASVAGELSERYLFFAAVAAPRMPGGIR